MMGSLQISGESGSDTSLLGRGVDGNEDQAMRDVSRHLRRRCKEINSLSLFDSLVDVSGEEQVLSTG